MGLTRTVPLVSSRSGWTAAQHRELLLALDEILVARYNGRSPRVFNASPQLLEGIPFYFRDSAFLNLNVGGPGPQYDPAGETPPDPIGGQVVAHDPQTKVIALTGYSHPETLVRRKVTWSPTGLPQDATEWWILRPGGRPERFLSLGVAEIYVEGYTDPLAGDDETFTWRAHWDRFGCIRVHNGNRYPLTLVFEGGSQASVVIPPYGIVSGRRENYDKPFEFDATYLHLTRQGDPLKWEMEHPGQYAANMEAAYHLRSELSSVVRVRHGIEAETTAQEQVAFLGRPPELTDNQKDWVVHPGKLLSVVLDKRDGSVSITELFWLGVDTIPDPAWADHVQVELVGGADLPAIRFTSLVDPPEDATDDEWEHDLIPVSSNITRGQVLSLRGGPVTVTLPTNPGRWHWLMLPYRDVIDNGATSWALIRSDHTGTETRTYERRYYGLSITPGNTWSGPEGAAYTLHDALPDPTDAPGATTTEEDKVGFIGASMTRWRRMAFNPSAIGDRNVVILSGLEYADTSGGQVRWHTSTFAAAQIPRRFVAWEPRKYMTSGDLESAHPQDLYQLGTPDGLGGDVGWDDQPSIHRSQVRVAMHGGWVQTPTASGRTVYLQGDPLHVAVEHVYSPGWWALHRDAVIAGIVPDGYDSITWRIPRLAEQWNALASAINAIVEVYPATIRDLYRDPLTIGLSGPFGDAVPFGAVVGRADNDDLLKDWCDAWGVDYEDELPGFADMRTLDRMLWVWSVESLPTGFLPVAWHKDTATNLGQTPQHALDYQDWQTRLYGGTGDGDGYVWVTHDALSAVFGPIGVPVPHPPIGMRYEPMIVEHTGVSQIRGGMGSSADSTILTPAQIPVRMPSDTGTWIQPIASDCRIMDPDVSMPERRLELIIDGPDFVTTVAEYSAPEDVTYRNSHSVFWLGSHLQPGLPLSHNVKVWPTYERIDTPVPVCLVVTSEPYVVDQWLDPLPPNNPAASMLESEFVQATFHEPESPDFRVLELSAGVITPELLRSLGAGGGEWRCFHVQILPRPGILRTSA